MTQFNAPARSIDNRRLSSLSIGHVYVDQLRKHVPWEGFGERALLRLVCRWYPQLTAVVPQPFRMNLQVGSRRVRYTPDYLLLVPKLTPEC